MTSELGRHKPIFVLRKKIELVDPNQLREKGMTVHKVLNPAVN